MDKKTLLFLLLLLSLHITVKSAKRIITIREIKPPVIKKLPTFTDLMKKINKMENPTREIHVLPHPTPIICKPIHHEYQNLTQQKTPDPVKKDTNIKKKYSCNKCKKKFNTTSTRHAHQDRYNHWMCLACFKCFSFFSDLDKHIRKLDHYTKAEKKAKPCSCKECGKRLKNDSSRKQHTREQHKKRSRTDREQPKRKKRKVTK